VASIGVGISTHDYACGVGSWNKLRRCNDRVDVRVWNSHKARATLGDERRDAISAEEIEA